MPRRSRSTLFTILLVWLVFYGSFALFHPALLDDADSVHVEVAREMLLRHDPVTLYANGIRYLEKAPLLYWSMAGAMWVARLFGAERPEMLAAAARVPLALSVLALALCSEALARRIFRSARAGFYAALILLSSFGVFIFTRITIPDALVCLWITVSLYAFWRTEELDGSLRRGGRVAVGIAGPDSPQRIKPRVGMGEDGTAESRALSGGSEAAHGRKAKHGTAESRAISGASAASLAKKSGEVPVWARASRSPGISGAQARMYPWMFAVSCALNVLTKGLIGVVFPVGIVLVYLLVTQGVQRAGRRIGQLFPLSSTLLFFAVAAPWHIAAGLANPTQGHPTPFAFLRDPNAVLPWGHWQVPLPTEGNVRGWWWFYFMNEHLLRYLNLRVPRDYDTVPLVLFWGLCLVWLMPWSAFVFKAASWAIPLRSAKWRGQLRRHDLPLQRRGRLLLVVAAAFVLLFFSLSTRQEYYILPALPAGSVLIAGWLAYRAVNSEVAEAHRRAGRRITAVLSGLGLVAAAACVFFILHTRQPAPDTDLAQLLQQNPGEYALSFGHFLDLNAKALGMFRLPLALTAISFGVGFPLAWYLRTRREVHRSNLALIAATLVFLLAAHLGLQTFAPVLSSAQLAEAIRPQLKPGDLLVLHGEYEAGSTLGFYLGRPLAYTDAGEAVEPLHIFEGRSSNLWYGSFFPDAPRIFETPESLAAKWAGPQRVFLWQSLTDPPKVVPLLPGPVFVVARSGGKEILSNRE